MHKFKKITIIGVGLLGGSIGLAVRKKNLAAKVTGFFRHKEKIAAAARKGMIDEGTGDFRKAVQKSDLIILCSPVSDIVKRLGDLKEMGLDTTLITDTGSTKVEITTAGRGLNFIGSHPLAGSEASGIEHSRADLFCGSICILTPDRGVGNSRALAHIAGFWKAIGAVPVVMTPEKHDKITSFASHLPHAVAFSLIDSIPDEMVRFGAGGLRDTTRISLSNPDIWIDIFFSNRKNILRSLSYFASSLQKFKKALTEKNRKRMLSFLSQARTKRKGLNREP